MFLTQEEIRELTGLAYNKRQVTWLAERGYKFEITVAGVPKVLRAHLEERLGGMANKKQQEQPLDFSNSKYFG